MSNDLYSTASKRNCFSCGEQMLAPADHPMPLCPSCAPEYGMPGLKKTFGENPRGKYGTDRGGDDYYEVSHPAGYTIRSYSIPGVGSDYFSIHDETGSEFEDGKRVNHEVDGFVRPNKEEGKVTHEEMEKHLGDWVSENHPELKSEGSKIANLDGRCISHLYPSDCGGETGPITVPTEDGKTHTGLICDKGRSEIMRDLLKHREEDAFMDSQMKEHAEKNPVNTQDRIELLQHILQLHPPTGFSVDHWNHEGLQFHHNEQHEAMEDEWPDAKMEGNIHSHAVHKTSGRNGVTCPKCQRWFDLDDAPQDWYSHNCESGDSKSTAAKTAIWGTPEGGSDIVQGLIYGVPAGLFALDQGMKRVVHPIMDHIERKKDQKRKEQRLQEEEETNNQNSANQDPREASFKSAGEQAPYDTNCDHCGQPGATRSLKMDHTGYPKVDWHCDDCKDKTEDQRFEDIMKNGARNRRYMEEHFRVSSADDPTMAYHDSGIGVATGTRETWLYHPKCVHEAAMNEEAGWADKVKSNNGMSFRNLRTSYPDGADCTYCGDGITWARPHFPEECEPYEHGDYDFETGERQCKAPEEHMGDDEHISVADLPAQNTGADRAPWMSHYGSDHDLEQMKENIKMTNVSRAKYDGTNERRKKDEQELGGQINETFSSPEDKKKLELLQSNPTGPTHLSARQVFASIGIDYDLFESVRPEPTKQEQGHASRHGSYPDSFYDRHWDAYDAARDAGQASPQGGRTGSINNEVLDSHLTIGSTSMKVIASTPTHEISQDVVPAEIGQYDCEHCADGTEATHHVITGVHDLNDPTHSLDNPNPNGAYSFADTCEKHIDKAKDKEHTNSIAWMAKQGSLKTKSVGKQVCQTCRHSDDAHKVSTEWYCNPGEGGCGGNGVLSESVNQPYSSDHEDGCENPGAVEYNEGNEYCQGGGGRECICEGFANTKPKWSVNDEPELAADDTDGDDYVNPNDDDDSGFFNNLRTKSSKWDTCLCGHGRPEHRDVDFKGDGEGHCLTCKSDLKDMGLTGSQWDGHDCGKHGEFTDAEDHEEMHCTGDEENCKYAEGGGMCEDDDCDEDAMTGYHYCSDHFDDSRFASYVDRVSTPVHLAAILQWTNDSLAVTASYDSLFHPDAADHSSVVPMTCHECEEDYDAPAWGGVIMADECPNCGSDATYQKGKKNTFAEDAREDWNEQDPR